MASAFPTTLDDLIGNQQYTDGVTELEAVHFNNWQDAIDNMQEKIGVDGSAVTTSHDYKINRRGVQTVIATDATVVTGSTPTVNDDTIPQNTEGSEFITRAITPTNASNILEIEAFFYYSVTPVTSPVIWAIFQDTTASALRAGMKVCPSLNVVDMIHIKHRMAAGTTSSTTFKFRCGLPVAHTMTMNGSVSARKLGGVMISTLQITEWKV